MLHSLMFYLYSNLPLSWGVRSYLARFACPDNEPLHFHHDGCPCCDEPIDYRYSIENHHFTEPIDCYSGVCDCVDK